MEETTKTYKVVTEKLGTRNRYGLHVSTEIMVVWYISRRELNQDVKGLKEKGYILDEKTVTLLTKINKS